MTARSEPVTIVGGGIAGLVAAITAAERGAQVQLCEGLGVRGRGRRARVPVIDPRNRSE